MKEAFLPFHLFENRFPGLEIIFDLVFIDFSGLLFVLWLVWEIKKPETRKKKLLTIAVVFTLLLLLNLNWVEETSSFQKPPTPSYSIPSSSSFDSLPFTHENDGGGRRSEEMRFGKSDEIGGRRRKWKEEEEELGEEFGRKKEEEGKKRREEEERRKGHKINKEGGEEGGGTDWVGMMCDFIGFLLDVLV